MKPLKKFLLLLIVCFTLLAAAVATAEEAIEDIRRQAELGDAVAQFALGVSYALGAGVKEDQDETVRWFRKAAEQGHIRAQYNLGVFYALGEGVKEDKREAARWYRKAAEQGYPMAQFNIGAFYAFGEGVKKDNRKAAHWYRKAAAQRVAKAQYNLGVLYEHGKGVKEDKREAARWYRKAAEQGDSKAQFNLGVLYEHGKGVNKDRREAVRWYRKAAEQGEAIAQFHLGHAYNFGKGVKEDKREAVRWYHKAAEQGNTKAQFRFGNAYAFGEGTKQNISEAVLWYRKSAKQGHPMAQFALGIFQKDKSEAAHWLLKAAEQGHPMAQFTLGNLYWDGRGVVENQYEAYIWYLIAKANAQENAIESLQQKPWSRFLTEAETRSAKREATRRFTEIKKRQEQSQSADNSLPTDVEFAIAKPYSEINIAAKVFKNTWRSVVMIKGSEGQGSGVVIRPNLVATACHVVNGGDIIIYKPDNKRIDTGVSFYATILHRDDARDFCILEVDGLWSIPATIRKYDTLNVGENVYAVGAPRGFDMSLSDGLVSQLRNTEIGRLIQTNAAVSPGSSGGGLFDTEGNLIGIVTSKFVDESTEGIAFAIPADLALEI